MSKHIESSLRARKFRLPVAKVAAGLGAALVLAGPSVALAQSKNCPVTFTVSNAAALGSLQFDVDYSAATAGDFANSCTFVDPSGLTDVHVNVGTNKLGIGWVDATGFAAPGGLFVTCNFVEPSSSATAPVAGNFVVSGIAASTADAPPVDTSAGVVVAVGACTDAAPACQNGVLESGEDCDDGNAVAGDGCDAACGLSSCPSTASTGCRVSTVSGKSKIILKNSLTDDTKDSAQYQWKDGAATDLADWKDPTTAGKTYSWCLYDGGDLVKGATVAGGASAWKAAGKTGYGFKGDVQGISGLTLKGGLDGKASIGVKIAGKSGHYRSPALATALTGPTLSQVVVDDGVAPLCFQTTAGTPLKNTAALYEALGNP